MALSLKDRIARMIRASGPMPLAGYMQLCLHDAAQGYYANRQAIGAKGDFVTAPEVSQMFGELIGVWCASVWQAMGSPNSFILAEAGPGKGTLMADLLRAARAVPGFLDAAEIRLIEASPVMIEHQKQALAGTQCDIDWAVSLETLPGGPLILIANEFLDCLPVRQFVKSGSIWRERCIGLDENDALATMLGTATLDASQLPPGHEAEPDGAVFETSPARQAWAEQLGHHIAENGGAALLVDYGHGVPGFGDTFQAMRGQAYVDPLAEPGLADLTSHVDFAAICEAAERGGAATAPLATQAEFLTGMGLLERAGRLGHGQSVEIQDEISTAVERLAAPDAMGKLFKVFAMADTTTFDRLADLPPFRSGPALQDN